MNSIQNFFKSPLLGLYRSIQSQAVKRWVRPYAKVKTHPPTKFEGESKSTPRETYWFHAASVGELESIWLVVLEAAQRKSPIVLTVFSKSAEKAVKKLSQEIVSAGGILLYSGYSPWEGEWRKAFQVYRPKVFVTVKYEAWPDLWVSLVQENIPLVLVSARLRTALKVAKNFSVFFAGKCPQTLFLTCEQKDETLLREEFPDASIQWVGEPRWDRVFQRVKVKNPRVAQLVKSDEHSPRPWGILGSAWKEDLVFLKSFLQSAQGTLWIVPHEVAPEHVQGIEDYLISMGLQPRRTSQGQAPTPPKSSHTSTLPTCILVDELGFLSELYSVADYAFVGGGFGAGVHSTIEPAIHGIPIAIGPEGSEKFSEVSQLRESGQLQVLRNESDLISWGILLQSQVHSKKSTWMDDAKGRLGATDKIWRELENLNPSWYS